MCNCKYFYFLSVEGNEEDAAALGASCRSAVSPWCYLLWQDRLAWVTGCPTKHRFVSCSREVRLRKVSCIHIGILFLQARLCQMGMDITASDINRQVSLAVWPCFLCYQTDLPISGALLTQVTRTNPLCLVLWDYKWLCQSSYSF